MPFNVMDDIAIKKYMGLDRICIFAPKYISTDWYESHHRFRDYDDCDSRNRQVRKEPINIATELEKKCTVRCLDDRQRYRVT